MINPLHVRTLEVVVRTGGFASAAQELGYTASAISQQMASLERDSGIQLFERGAKQIRVTENGRTIARLAERMLDDWRALDRKVDALRMGEQGVLRIGSFPTAATHILPGALARLKQANPAIKVTLREAETASLLDMLSDDEIDVALVIEYDIVPRSWPLDVTVTDLASERLHLMRAKPVLDPDEWPGGDALRAEQWVCSTDDTDGAVAVRRLCESWGFEPRIAFQTNNLEVLRALVSNGLGVALIPQSVREVERTVVATPVPHPQAARRIIAAHRGGDNEINPLVPPVIEMLRRSSQKLGL